MKTKARLYALGTLLGFLLLCGLLDLLLPLAGLDRWLLWGGLGVLGVIAAALVYLHFAPRGAAAAPGSVSPESDIDLPVAAARRRLAGSGVKGGRLGRLPLVLVLGPGGSAKTSAVLNSGLQPDLLAGEVTGPDAVAPTAALNLWYAQDGLVVEAGGPLLDDDRRWSRLLQHIRPTRLAAAFGRGKQAPRLAVVCFSCEELLKPGAGEAVPAAARKLRARLAEVSQQLGIRLPVYVLFTKADRVPHFEEYVRGLTREEAQQALGATLPLADVAPGAYADHQAGRLRDAFHGIFRSLAAWRLQLLPREARELARTGAYEFPREVTKVSGLAEQFLLELCRPSQLGVNPFLRGFYLTGVRPVVVSDAVPEGPAAGAGPQRVALGATGVFSIQGFQQAAAPTPTAAGSRRVPEWVFLRRVLPEIVLRDRRAMDLTAGGTRVDLLRRGLVGAAAVLFLLLSAAFSVSFLNNRALAADALAATQGVEPLRASVAEAPPADALQRLDELRAVLARIGAYERQGRPWRLGWGLYTGDDLHPPLRQAYFERFARLLWNDQRGDLLGSLEGLPQAPQETSEYGTAYDALKAHLVTTSHPRESSAAFLTPVVMRHWRPAAGLEPEREELVRRQLDFYADELPHGNPYRDAPAEPLVVRTRGFLQRFTGLEPLYQALLADAGRAGTPIQFHRMHPGTEAVVRNTHVVPAAFTRDGWAHVQTALDNVDRLLTREDWVVGERSVVPAQDRARLAQELRTRYVADYVGAWREYLRASSVVAFGGPADAAGKLSSLSGNDSPLLRMLAVASWHTSMDTVVVARVFQPVHLVVPPGDGAQLVSEANAPYLSSLTALQLAMDQVAQAAGPARLDALAQASGNAEQVNLQVRQLAQGFSIQGDAREVGLAVQRLLQAPISGAETLARALPSAEANAQGTSFCQPIRRLAAKYPFNPRGATDAPMDEVAAVLQPGGSALWSFYDESLQNLLVRQGSRYAARIGADPQPTATFVSFFNRAAEVSNGLFPREGAGPQVTFALRPQASEAIPEIRVSIDGQTQAFTPTVAASRTFTWEGERARTARITGRIGATEVTLVEAPEGPWALFRLMQAAEWERTGTGRFRLRWRIPVEQQNYLTADIDFAGASPVFSPGYLNQLDCVAQIVR
jgi:type VI secretion system protein ImpL